MKIFLLLLFITIGINGYSQCLQADIVIVADFSGSVYGYQDEIKTAFYSFINKFELGSDQVRMGLIVFAENSFVVTPVTYNKNALNYGLETMFNYPIGNKTNINKPLVMAYDLLIQDRFGVRKFIIIISDGVSNVDSRELMSTVNEIKSMPDISICGILIDSEFSNPKFMRIMSDSYCYKASDYVALQETLAKLDLCL